MNFKIRFIMRAINAAIGKIIFAESYTLEETRRTYQIGDLVAM